jgi:UDP-N-acetylglucosamine acyltransferase
MPSIHPTASVAPGAELAADVEVGPFCSVSAGTRLGPGVKLLGHVYTSGPVTIGEGTTVYPFACIGFPPQDVKFKIGDSTAGVVIGKNGLIREHATIHAASNDHTPTTAGDRIFMMVNSHLGHDAKVGNNVVMVNNSAVGGHGQLQDNVTLGGGALVHQFCRVGRLAMMSGGIAISVDVMPFCIADERNRLAGINLVGLRRAGWPREHITEVRRAFRDLLRSPMDREEQIAECRRRAEKCPPLAEWARFIVESKERKRGICPGHGKVPRLLSTFLTRLRRGETSFASLVESDED